MIEGEFQLGMMTLEKSLKEAARKHHRSNEEFELMARFCRIIQKTLKFHPYLEFLNVLIIINANLCRQ